MYFALRNSLIEKDPSFKVDLPYSLKDISYSILHYEKLSCAISKVDLPGVSDRVFFVYLNRDRLYTERSKNLYVYSLSNLLTPIATYPIGSRCWSGIINENRLYLGGEKKLHIFEATTSITQPLIMLTVIDTASGVSKILKVGHELLLGQSVGCFQAFDIDTSAITHTHKFTEGDNIYDIIAFDDTHYLLAAIEGLLKATKKKLIKHYHKGKWVRSLCHVTHSFYLVGFLRDGLILWNE